MLYILVIYFSIETETKALRPRKKCKEKEENIGRHVYPVDIWFTLAAYIDPEAVRNFATLCKDSYLVTRTRQFWKNLYTRYLEFICIFYQKVINLWGIGEPITFMSSA